MEATFAWGQSFSFEKEKLEWNVGKNNEQQIKPRDRARKKAPKIKITNRIEITPLQSINSISIVRTLSFCFYPRNISELFKVGFCSANTLLFFKSSWLRGEEVQSLLLLLMVALLSFFLFLESVRQLFWI